MPYFSPKKIITRDPTKLGFVDGKQVYDIVQETTDHFREFHQTEPAIVKGTYFTADSLPKRKLNEDHSIPDWSKYGTISAVFIQSETKLPRYIKPLSHNIITYPVKGEIVNITKFKGEWFYSIPLNLHQKINMNRNVGERGDGKVVPQHTKFNRRVWSGVGSTLIQGRFGNSIKLGSDSLYQTPTVKIVNGQNQRTDTLQAKNLDMYYPHLEDINYDGSSIYMTSGTDTIPLIPAAHTMNLPKALYGNQIILNSDRLIFNAKGKVTKSGINLTGGIHMLAVDDIVLSAGDKFIVESTQICLGPDSEIAKNPLAKYEELAEVLEDMVDVIEAILSNIEVVSISINPDTKEETKTSSMATHKRALKSVEKSIRSIASRNVFTTFE